MTENQAIIKLDNVSIFQQNNLILSDVSLEVNAGEFHYLIGSTGSGKSTLLKVLYGDLPIEKGTASLAGLGLENLKKSDIPMLRRKLGVIFQDFQLLFDRDVHDNLLFVLNATGWKKKDEKDKRIQEVLDLVGLSTKSHKMPFELSGGEQQRVAIARALLNKPELILADEPTGNLDPKTSDDILELLHEICKTGTAVLMATHDYRILEKFPAGIIRCEGGKVLVNKLLKETN
ncbi:MAG: ATP-binding cassette domain-containing protein [Bacteroidia bacterium]|nr:ATP-binding cassette domain-containing protein [Bacteroidia bacterium]MCF8425482.1 ATP-binding cassette domain-containing protein [Bacteroidia bacterium]MCF8445898.1 ATP-binding cassette domain-containing protein [Bacteroidia bacterium]